MDPDHGSGAPGKGSRGVKIIRFFARVYTQAVLATGSQAYKKKGGTAADQSERKIEKWYLMF